MNAPVQININFNVAPIQDGSGALVTFAIGPCSYQIAVPWEALPAMRKALEEAEKNRPRIVVANKIVPGRA